MHAACDSLVALYSTMTPIHTWLRTLVGEDDGLAVALTHGGLLWQTAGGIEMDGY